MSTTRSRILACALLSTAVGCGGGKSGGGTDGGNSGSAKIDSFTADKTTVARGAKVKLAWTVEGATKISIAASPGGSVVDSSTKLMDTADSGVINADTAFTLTAFDAEMKTTQATVMVKVDVNAVTISSFTADPSPALLGGWTALYWEVAGATHVKISQGSTDLHIAQGEELSKGIFIVKIDQPSVMVTLLATNDMGKMDTNTLTIAGEKAPVLHSFKVTPEVWMGASQSVMVSWTTTDASKVIILQNGMPATGFTPNTATGTIAVTISATTRFEIFAVSGGGSSYDFRITAQMGGMEIEPNNDFMHANPLGASGGIQGAIMPGTDTDFFSFTVPEGGHVYAETFSLTFGMQCYDTEITLWGPDGMKTITSDDDSGGMRCSLIDPQADANAVDLAAGTYFVDVHQSLLAGTATATGNYGLGVIVGGPACGNGIQEKNESCDDSAIFNSMTGLCRPDCTLGYSGEITGSMGSATVPLLGFDDLRRIKVSITRAGQGISATSVGAGGSCTISNQLALEDSKRNLLIFGTADGTKSDCSTIRFPDDVEATNLAVGTYYIAVTNSTMAAGLATVNVTIHDPACGNGATEYLAGEQCDDGNMAAGDGCSSACMVEPKGTLSGPGASPAMPMTMTFSAGPLKPKQQDYYTITMSQAGYILGETGAPTIGMCTNHADTVLELVDPMTFKVLGGNDDIATDNTCSRIFYDPNKPFVKVEPGMYYLRVREFTSTSTTPTPPIDAYQLQVKLVSAGCGNTIIEPGETCDDGNVTAGDGCSATCHFEGNAVAEMEPNNDAMHATPSTATKGHTVTINGGLTMNDTDFFSFVVPGGMTATLDARIHTTFNMATSCATGVDTVMNLLNATGTLITTNDDIDTGMGILCSEINGTTDMTAANLAAGTYYIQVNQYDMTGSIPVYFLDVKLQ